MKLFGVDTAIKWISLDVGDESFLISFRESFFKGIYDVSLWKGSTTSLLKDPVSIVFRNAYPSAVDRLRTVALLARDRLKLFIQHKT